MKPNDTPTPQQVDSACMSVRHDFGLLSNVDKEKHRFIAREWLHAWQKEFDQPATDTYPIFDILPRLWAAGFTTEEQGGQWWLFDSRGNGIVCGRTFRDLCMNIVLAGL